MSTQSNPPRAEIHERYRWNAESVFTDLNAWEDEIQIIDKALNDGQVAPPLKIDSATLLVEVMESASAWLTRGETVYLYAAFGHSVETTSSEAMERFSRARTLLSRVESELAAIAPRIVALGEETIQSWLKQEKPLEHFQHYLEDLFRKQAHIRSQEVETLISLLGDPFSGTAASTRMLTSADFKFPPALSSTGEENELTQGSQPGLMNKPDRALRRSAWENYLDLYLDHQNVLAANLETAIKQSSLLAKTRNFGSTLEAALFEYQIPEAIFHNLVTAFVDNIPLWHRYWGLRKRVLGVDPLEPYDAWAPLTSELPHVPYEQAVDWICAGLEPMGEEYVVTLRRGCGEDRWVDVYPNQGKRGGAYSSGVHGTHPFIMMSYNNSLISMSTLAHELGHSMHSYLAWQSQPAVYSRYSLFVAEVASNFHQAMVRAYLLRQPFNAAFKIAVIEEAMANYYRYFLIMPTLARFEHECHRRIERGQGLTAPMLNNMCAAYFAEAFGPAMHIDPDRIGILWATFGHLYVDYYVFQYATGIAGAAAISQAILSGDEDAVEKYLNCLKLGGACHPLDALDVAGVDLRSPRARPGCI